MDNQAETGQEGNPEAIAQTSKHTLGEDVGEQDQSPPPITGALEALLGGLSSPDENVQMKDAVENTPCEAQVQEAASNATDQIHTAAHEPAPEIETAKEELKGQEAVLGANTDPGVEDTPSVPDGEPQSEVLPTTDGTSRSQNAPKPDVNLPDVQMPDVSLPDDRPKSQDEPQTNNTGPESAVEEEHPEWEIDSSPIESSSEESSSDDSSSEDSDEDGDDAYKLLSPEEQARILMEGDGASDDEGGNKAAKGSGGQLRTKNEVPEELIPKPDVTITSGMPIEELGAVEAIVENILLIKAKISGEYRVLESGSVLCLADRSVIGAVSETLGRVQQPLYSVRFTNAGEITEAGLAVGTTVFYSEKHSNYVFTQTLKAYKGSDASNLHDEEVGDEEIEFSDDEAEMEHKKRLKQRKIEKRGGKMQHNGGLNRRGQSLQQQHSPLNGLSYDDAEDDGPYKPLSRPTGYADTMGRTEAPEEGAYSGNLGRSSNGAHGDRGDFRGRGRSDRGRGRGERGRGGDQGRGRGGFQDRRNNSGYSLPPQDQPNPYAQLQQSPVSQFPQPMPQSSRAPGLSPPGSIPNIYNAPQQEYSPHQPQMWPRFPQPPVQPFPNMQNTWPNIPPSFSMPTGAFINPAFFPGNQYIPPNQPGQQNQQEQLDQQSQQNLFRGNGGTQDRKSYG